MNHEKHAEKTLILHSLRAKRVVIKRNRCGSANPPFFWHFALITVAEKRFTIDSNATSLLVQPLKAVKNTNTVEQNHNYLATGTQ